MFKLILAVLMLAPTMAMADAISIINTLKQLPDLKQGVAFDLTENEFNYLSTVGVLKYGDFGLNAGYSADNKLVATFNYDIGGLKKLGIDTPITNLIDLSVGFYAGYGRITGDNEFSYGPTVSVINVRF